MNEVTAYYADGAPMHAQTSPKYVRTVFEKLLTEVGSRTTVNEALDLGSGIGFNLAALSKVAKHIHAGDIADSALAESKQRNASLGNVDFDICDAQNMQYKDNYFDLVVSTETLEHVPELDAAAREIARVVKPGGYVIITTPNYLNFTGIVKKVKDKKEGREFWDPWGAHADGIERHVTPNVLLREFTPHFTVEKYIGIDYAGGWFFYLPYGKAIFRTLLAPLGYLPFFKRFALHNVLLLKKK